MTIDGQFRNQRAVNVAGVGTVGGSVGATVPGIRCFQMQVFVIMLENAEAKKGYKELSITKKDVLYMAKDLQEVPNADSSTDAEPLEHVQYDTDDNVFTNDIQHFDQSQSISNTCAVETDDSNVTPDSPDMCDNDIQDDQNDSRMTQQCPSAYTWVPKTKRKWVPKVRNESVTKKIGTTIYSLLTWMHKDMRANLSNAVQFCTKNIAVPFVMQMINLLNLLAMEIWFKGHITDQKASFPNDKRRQIDNPDPVLNVQNVSPLADTQQFSSQRSWISFRVLLDPDIVQLFVIVQDIKPRRLKNTSKRLKDANHVRCLDTRKSTSGGIQFLGDKLVACLKLRMAKKQDCIALSSAMVNTWRYLQVVLKFLVDRIPTTNLISDDSEDPKVVRLGSKKQKGDDDQEEAEMKRHIEIVKDDEVAIDAYTLVLAPGIDREDLETLWKLVKAKHENTRPEDDYERVLWGDLKVAAMVSAGDVVEVAKMVDMVLWVASAVMVVAGMTAAAGGYEVEGGDVDDGGVVVVRGMVMMMTVVAGCGCRRGWRRVAASGYGDRGCKERYKVTGAARGRLELPQTPETRMWIPLQGTRMTISLASLGIRRQ
ncbi:hypothetical protein Tco_0446756 [Tanacetum coccineum]